MTTDRLRREARAIAARLQPIRLRDGRTGHVGYMDSEQGVTPKARPGLYCGQLGVAVYLGAMYAAVGDESYRRRAKETQVTTDRDVSTLLDGRHVGIGTGVGSSLYGLTLLASFTGDDEYRQHAARLVDGIDGGLAADDDQYDVLLGSAGIVLALLAYYERTDDRAALDAAVDCGEQLLAARYEKWNDYRLWDTSRVEGVASTAVGMGHGVAGIAYALCRLADHCGESRFGEAAREAVRFENLFYADRRNNWLQNFGGVDHYTDWWCSGRVGIGAARLGSVRHHPTESFRRDLDRVRTGLDTEPGEHDSLCHGTAGRIDLLVDLADGDQPTAARELAVELLDRRGAEYRVAPPRAENDALFLGTAGVGYALLRALDPSLPALVRVE